MYINFILNNPSHKRFLWCSIWNDLRIYDYPCPLPSSAPWLLIHYELCSISLGLPTTVMFVSPHLCQWRDTKMESVESGWFAQSQLATNLQAKWLLVPHGGHWVPPASKQPSSHAAHRQRNMFSLCWMSKRLRQMLYWELCSSSSVSFHCRCGMSLTSTPDSFVPVKK